MSPEESYRQIPVKVAARVHVLHQAEPFQISPVGNVAIIEQSDGLVLVDSGGSVGSGERVVAEIRKISRKPVKAVVVTHWHNDHPLGLPAILREWPEAAVIATEATAAQMRAGKLGDVPMAPSADYDGKRVATLEGYIEQYAPQRTDPTLTEKERAEWSRLPAILRLRMLDAPGAYLAMPTIVFKDRYMLPDRDAPVEILFLGPGNTSGDAIVWAPKQKVIAAGDLVVSPIPYALNGYPKTWIADLEKLKAYDFKILVPGHGLPQNDRAYLDKLIALIAEARTKAAALADRQLTDDEVLAKIDLSAQRRIFAGDDPWLGYWFDQYAAPIAIAAYHEARGDPIDA